MLMAESPAFLLASSASLSLLLRSLLFSDRTEIRFPRDVADCTWRSGATSTSIAVTCSLASATSLHQRTASAVPSS